MQISFVAKLPQRSFENQLPRPSSVPGAALLRSVVLQEDADQHNASSPGPRTVCLHPDEGADPCDRSGSGQTFCCLWLFWPQRKQVYRSCHTRSNVSPRRLTVSDQAPLHCFWSSSQCPTDRSRCSRTIYTDPAFLLVQPQSPFLPFRAIARLSGISNAYFRVSGPWVSADTGMLGQLKLICSKADKRSSPAGRMDL